MFYKKFDTIINLEKLSSIQINNDEDDIGLYSIEFLGENNHIIYDIGLESIEDCENMLEEIYDDILLLNKNKNGEK